MNRLKSFLNIIRRHKSLKYIIVVVVAVVIVGFVDENSVWNHFRNKQKINELETEIAKYNRQHEQAKAQLKRLDTDPKAIQKIARERYFMKADDEDIFVLSEDLQPEQTPEDETTE
ncbi:MAG: septum formation initiator family protein [Prevotella sp.]